MFAGASHRAVLVAGILVCISTELWGQIVPVPIPTPTPSFGGVYVEPDGTVRYRELDARQLAELRARARNANAKDAKLAYVSLPKVFARAQELVAAGKPLPDDLRYLSGLTQIRYIFIYPEEKDLVIAGPAEAIDTANALEPVGKRTGRPVLQLEDLIAAMRVIGKSEGSHFGCSIDPAPDAMQRAKQVVNQVPRQMLPVAVARAIGPQTVSIHGVPADTRLAMVCVAADYKLKRLTLGIDPSPVAGLSHAVDNSREAGNRWWFELSYEPLLMAEDGNAFELRGQRLQLKCGALPFDERGATATAKNFAKQFTAKFPQLAAVVPAFADLQNVADLSVLAALIRQDKLDRKVGWDSSWILSNYQIAKLPTPRTAETLAAIRSGSLAAGGVNLAPGGVVSASRQRDEKGVLVGPKREAKSR